MAIRINRVYTRTGDGGRTRLVGGAEVAKDSRRVEAYGCVDELYCVVGLARTFNEDLLGSDRAASQDAARYLDDLLKRLQNQLFDLGSELATPPGAEYAGMYVTGDAEVAALESVIDRCQEDLAPLQSFVLPGGGRVGAFLHQARTVCRRAEREAIRLAHEENVNPAAIRYLNRLSDLLFVLARWIAHHQGKPEALWERGLHPIGETAASTAEKPGKKG